MDQKKNKRILVSAIACALGLSISPVSIAANNILINSNLDPDNTNIDALDGAFSSNDDGAILKFESIESAWSLDHGVTVDTKEFGDNLESGTITLDAALDFNNYTSSSLSLAALDDITINADIADSNNVSADSLTLQLSPAASVNLNATIGEYTNTTINGGLVIGAAGTYKLVNASDSLIVDSITKEPAGQFNYTAGSLTLNSALNIDNTGPLNDAVIFSSAQNMQAASMSVGTLDAASGSFTQSGGTNTVVGALTVNKGGSYALTDGALLADSAGIDGSFTQSGGTNTVTNTIHVGDTGSYELSAGSLSAGDITRSATGTVTYTGGDLTLTSGTLAIEEDGALGASVTIGSTQNLQTANQTVGTAAPASGSFTQDGGTNTVDGTLTINAGGSYALNGGTLDAGSIINDGAINVAGTFSVADGNSYTQSGNLTANDVNADGVLTQNDGVTSVTNAMNVSETGSYTLVAGEMVSGSLSTEGSFTQSGGTNTVNNVLTVQANGTYNMDGGNLQAASISNNGVFAYTDGGVLLTGSALDINGAGLLGNAVTIDTGEVFGATSMTIGDGALDSGAVIQHAGSNTITNALTVNNNGSYTHNGGDLNVGSLLVTDGGTFAGTGLVNASGDITDSRSSGIIDASYTGANISLAADTMNGAINASESITLDSITVNGVVTGTAMALSGGTNLTNDVNLQPYVLNTFYDYSVINSVSGNNTISGNVSITPLEVYRYLSIETVDSASIDVASGSLAITGNVDASLMDLSLNVVSGSSLSLQGASTSTKNLSANVATGGSLLLGNTTATNFYANGDGSFDVNGALTTSGGNVTVQSGSLSASGADGAITADGSTIVVGTNTSSVNSGSVNTAQLIIDNSAVANSNRIGDATDVQLSTGSTLTLNGHATDAVTEKAGSLVVEHLNQSYTSSRDFVSNVVVNNGGAGTTQLTFDDLQIVTPTGTSVNRIDFATNGSFGGNEQIKFVTGPTLVDGLMQNATINGQEFVTYDNSLGIKSATTATNSFVAAGNILINSNSNLAANTTVNSLAVTTADVTGAGEMSLISGQMLLSGTSVIDPSINFGATEGYALVTGNSTLAGGVNGTNGMLVIGGGTLNLAAAGTVAGAVTVSSGDLVLSADNALQGADITVYDSLDIGATTQNVNSLSTGSGFTGVGSVIANNDIYVPNYGTVVDANLQSLNGNVTVGADIMNGDINVTYDSDTALDPSKGVVRLGDFSYPYQSTAMNGNIVASDVYIRGTLNGNIDASADVNIIGTLNGNIGASAVYANGTVNGNIDASDRIHLSGGTSNGVISGAGDLTGNGTLYGVNTYTGSTSGTFSLRGNGSIANSADYTGSLYMYTDDGESNLDRIGDTAQINLNGTGRTLNLIGSGSDVTGIAISEDVGIINVSDNSEIKINIANSQNGSTTLTSDALVLGDGALAFLSLGDSSQLKFDVAPATIGSTVVIAGVYVDKEIDGSTMQTWTAYDTTNGVVEVAVAESSISSAASGDFIRVTDAVNSPLTVDHTIGAMTVDTTQTMSGSGALSLGSGQIQFWQDNTIDIAQINFGAEQAFLSNAGTNTITSVLTGSDGLRKIGEGKIVLGGINTYTGETLISAGQLEVTGSLAGDVVVSSGAALTLSNGGQVGSISSNSSGVYLNNTAFSNSVSNTISGYGSFILDNTSSLSNAGTMYQGISNNGGSVSNLSGGYISSTVANYVGSGLTNHGEINFVYNHAGATFNNTGTVNSLSNYGSYSGNSASVIGTVNNYSSFTNNGVINNSIRNEGTFVNNSDVSLNGFNTPYTSADTLRNYAGTFTNNARITVSDDSTINVDGSFINNNKVEILGAVNTQTISGSLVNNATAIFDVINSSVNLSGSLVNNATGIVDVINSTVNLNGSFTNKGSVDIDATSLVTGSGSYLQQGNKDATTVVNGRVETSVEINSGVLSGAGQIAGDLIIGPGGRLQPGNSPGLMTIEGNFDLSGVLDLEVAFDEFGTMVFDQLAIGGDFNVLGNGRVNFDLGAGIDESIFTGEIPELQLTDIFSSISESDPLSLASLLDTSLNISLASGDKFKLSLLQDESGAFLTSVEAVPVPAAAWLFGSGLLGLIGLARRRAC